MTLMTMTRIRMTLSAALIATLVASAPIAHAQETPEAHARHVLELMTTGKFDELFKEFNAQMAAALPPERLEQTWATLQAQAGPYKSVVDQRVQSIQGMTAVITGVQFERTVANYIVAFDADGRIAGLQFTPRPAAPAGPPTTTSPPPGSAPVDPATPTR
jgi:hypothetical protein